jgi:hypothetical protein
MRNIRFGWAASCRFEETYGKSIPQAMQVEQIGARLITHLAWAGMLHDEPNLSVRAVEPRIQSFLNSGGDILELAGQLVTALAESGVIGKPKPPEPETADDAGEPVGNEVGVGESQ